MKRILSAAAACAVSASFAAALPAPAHHRHFERTAFFSEIPLWASYSNGNIWTGWTSRWTDWPLTVDRSLEYIEGIQYNVTWPDFRRTLEEMRLGGIDGATFNITSRRLSTMIAEAIRRGEKIPALTIPDYPPLPRMDGQSVPPEMEDEPWFAPAFYNSNGFMYNGKPVVTCYWSFRTNPEEVQRRVAHLKEKYGDFYLTMNVGFGSVDGWNEKAVNGTLAEEDFETVRKRFRKWLRICDGIQFSSYMTITKVVDGEQAFDAAFFRRYVKPLILQVMAEPEFKDKLLGVNVGNGHCNTYMGGPLNSARGSRTLRDSLACALELDPDYVTFFEWDEWNENTGIRPTLWNSYSSRRIVRAMRAAHEGRTNEVLEGDDTSIPNVILSFHKTISLGDVLEFELLSVPDAAAKGHATVRLTLRDENGNELETFPAETLDLTRMDERRIRWDSALAGNACAIVPELEVEWDGGRRAWRDGLPFAEVRPTANWDRKWVLMPLRDLIDGATCKVEPAGERDGAQLVKVSVDSPRTVDRLEVLDGGDIVYSMSGDEKRAFREDADNYVFNTVNFCFAWLQKGTTLTLEGVKDFEWLQGVKRHRTRTLKLFPQGELTPDVYFRVPKAEATNGVVRIDWKGIGSYSIAIKDVLAEGVRAVSGSNGFCFAVHRFNRQAAFFDPVNAKRAESVAALVPDLPVSVIAGHAITADGKICRSKPIVVGRRSGKKVPIRVWSEMRRRAVTVKVDVERVPNLVYDLGNARDGIVAKSGFGWAFNGILGGSTFVATRRNRGSDSRQHCCLEKYYKLPSRAPAVVGGDEATQLSFAGDGTYFVLPGGAISTTAAYTLSFDFWVDDAKRDQEIFGCGYPQKWGALGFLRVRNGYLHGIGLSEHPFGDAVLKSKSPVKAGEWNHVEVVSDVETLRLVLNGESTERVPLLQPGRTNANAWFGGRPNDLFRGRIRNVRIRHGR